MRSFALLRHVLTLAVALASIAAPISTQAGPACRNLFSSRETSPLPQHQATVMGRTVRYSMVSGAAKAYDIVKHMPEFADDFLIHMNNMGHVAIWYRGVRIEGGGVPMQGIETQVRYLNLITPGVTFAVSGLPASFAESFQSRVDALEGSMNKTCVGTACQVMREVDLSALSNDKTYLRPVPLLKVLLDRAVESERNPSKSPRVRILSIGHDLETSVMRVSEGQTIMMKQQYSRLSAGFFVITPPVALAIWGALSWIYSED